MRIVTLAGAALPVPAPAVAGTGEGGDEPAVRSGRHAQRVTAIRRRPRAPRPLPATPVSLRARLQAAGLAVTPPRQQVLALLAARGPIPLSRRDIDRRLDYAIRPVTIQRVLGRLEAAGPIERVAQAGEGRAHRLRA